MIEGVNPVKAMVLAAGLGQRMRPLTLEHPKPLLRVGGETLLDHMLDKLAAAGVELAVVNVHYLPEQIEAYLSARLRPSILISDERECLLETGGALAKAAPMLGEAPIFVANTDQMWREAPEGPSVARGLAAAFDPARMDVLLLLSARETSLGYHGAGDFFREADGRLVRRGTAQAAPYVFAGLSIMRPQIFVGEEVRPFSANLLFDRAGASGRLFGHLMEPFWMHVGDPAARAAAESRWAQPVGS